VSAWETLDRELDLWRASGRRATLWWRDDDAHRASSQLSQLLDIATAVRVPVSLAVIPAALEPGLVVDIERCEIATVLQHGYAHRNHAAPGERSWELGVHRPVSEIIAELEDGKTMLERSFGRRFVEVLVPPWNRIDPEVAARLPNAGYRGLSTFGPRVAESPFPEFVQCNTHVDLIAWRRDRTFIGVDSAIGRLVEHLQARRNGRADRSEPTGILTHHLDLNVDAWVFLHELFERSCQHAATAWLDARELFDVGTSAKLATSARSA
jgi:hypothetical protein